MYDRIYDISNVFDTKIFDLIAILSTIAFVLLAFFRRATLILFILLGYSIVVVLNFINLISINQINIVTIPILLLLWFIREKKIFANTLARSLKFFNISFAIVIILSLVITLSYSIGLYPIEKRIVNLPIIWLSVLAQITPYLFILLFVYSIHKLLRKTQNENNNGKSTTVLKDLDELEGGNNTGNKTVLISIILIVILSILISLYPHLYTVNPENRFVGYDTGYYITWIREIVNSQSAGDVILYSLQQSGGDRSLSLLFIYAIHIVSQTSIQFIIEYIPLILSPLLAIIIYFLTFEITKNKKFSLMASCLTIFSSQISMGIYSGFYSNWLAIIIGYTASIFFIRYWRTNQLRHIMVFGIFLMVLSFTHLYTWLFFVVLFGLSIVLLTKDQYQVFITKTGMIIVLVILFSIIGFIVPWIMNGNITGFHNFVDLQTNDFKGFSWSFLNLFNFVILVSHGGLFSNIMFPILCLIFLVTYKKYYYMRYSIFLFSFLALGILTVFLGEIEFKTRILYNIPFQIPAAIGLVILYDRSKSKLLLVNCILLVASYTLYSLSNLYLVDPSIMYPDYRFD
jgi:hypothetical protein